MTELTAALAKAFNESTYKCVLSVPVSAGQPFKRMEVTRKGQGYQLERFTKTQAFHENVDRETALERLSEALGAEFRQYNGWDGQWEYAVKVTKKGKVLTTRGRGGAAAPKEELSHNREKNYLLREGTAIPALMDLGIFTKDGKVVNAMYDKYRQINRFVEIIDEAVRELDPNKPLSIIDFGCGKSYLTFILYHYFTALRGLKVTMLGLDLKEDVIARCTETAKRYGYTGLRFQVGDIGRYEPDAAPDIVISLHACDTATDYALYNAIRRGAKMIFSVPCCQHELAAQMESERLSLLTRYGIVKERTASLMTDAIRAALLEHKGYSTQLIEFVPFEHTPKNILIRAVLTNQSRERSLREAEAIMEEFHLKPTLYRLLEGDGEYCQIHLKQ